MIDFRSLQDLSHPSSPQHGHFMALHRQNFHYLSAGERESLFTVAQQFSPLTCTTRTIGSLRTTVSQRLMDQFQVHLDPDDLELRYADPEGDVFQVPNQQTIRQVLDEHRPEWRTRQHSYLFSVHFPLTPNIPIILRLTCYKARQGVILP